MRNSVNELFVECICDVFWVHVCVFVSLNVMKLLSCCVGRLCAKPFIVFQQILVFRL